MKRKHVIRAMNLMRAIEANARISKVLLHELADVRPKVEDGLGASIDLSTLRNAIDLLIGEADEVHEVAGKLAEEAGIEIPPDDAPGVELVVQCCGTK